MHNSIILSAGLFGSVYLCGISFVLINNSMMENGKMPNKLIVFNVLTFVISGSIVVYGFRHLLTFLR
jgi:hypothetical protein